MSIVLSEKDILQALIKNNLKDWKLTDQGIHKEFKFPNFPTAVIFVTRLVDPAEEMNHHPDIAINYNRVKIFLTTHSDGGVTEKDVELARKIEELNPKN